jgi:hypothetical protein
LQIKGIKSLPPDSPSPRFGDSSPIAKARSTVTLRRGRMIGTDRPLFPVLHVPSNNQEHEQGSSEDYAFDEMHP